MATQKNSKSSRAAAPKSKSSKASPVKKSVVKAVSKGKQPSKSVSASKPKTALKSSKAIKAKKVAPVIKKAKPVVKKQIVKPVPKPVAKKSSASKAAPAKAIQAKQAQKATSKPISASKPAPKSGTLLKGKATSSSKVTSVNIANTGSKPMSKATNVRKPEVAVTAKGIVHPGKKGAPNPAIHAQHPKSIVKPVMTSRTPEKQVFAAKANLKLTGSKVSDLVKPSVGSKPMSGNAEAAHKPKEFQRKSLKQNTVHSVKPYDTMSDKKEIKPVGATYSDEPHKTRYNDKELEEFDQLIDQKLIVAREQLEFYLKQLEDMAENPDNKIKGLDDGLSTLESERVSSMAARQQKLIQHLENAKIRIKNKVYGICRETGRLISKERLRAVPHATLSIEAKQAQN